MKAIVKFFNDSKGYGILILEDGRDVFVHYSEILGNGFKTLREGQSVTIDLYETTKGLIAKNVVKS